MSPLRSLIASGTKLWLDSIDPDLIRRDRAAGATGATSNPIIVSDLVRSGRFDEALSKFLAAGKSDEEVAWMITDQLVRDAQDVFHPVWSETKGNDGYVSFELDPLIEDPAANLPHSVLYSPTKRWSATGSVNDAASLSSVAARMN